MIEFESIGPGGQLDVSRFMLPRNKCDMSITDPAVIRQVLKQLDVNQL